MSVVKEAKGIGDELKGRRTDALSFPIDIETAACPMFRGKGGKPLLQEAAVERGVVGDDEHYPAE